jgi:hypothetical protein
MAQINVNGRQYELVTLDDLTLDEAIVVWEYTRLSLDQIPELEGFHPGVIAALIHVSVARAEPGETAKTIRALVGKIRVADLNTVFIEISEEVEELPPPSAPEPSSPSAATGAASSPTGEPPPAASEGNGSGSPGSATGATSGPRISVP